MAVTQGLGDGFALYNGVKFPNIESVWTDEVKEEYPYAVITQHESDGTWELYIHSKPSTLQFEARFPGLYSLLTSGAGKMQIWKPSSTDNNTWVQAGGLDYTEQVDTKISNPSIELIWANFDIYDSTGTLYLAATVPLTLDGMQVIEWDGDTTGLVSNPDGTCFKVAEVFPATQTIGGAIAMISDGATYGGTIVESDLSAIGDITFIKGVVIFSYAENELIPGTGLYFMKDDSGAGYTTLLAYTPAAEPEQPKWQFNLRDFLSGMASAAASRGALRRTPIAYIYNGVQLPGLPEVDYPHLYILRDSKGGYYLKCLETTITALSGGAFPPVSTGIAFYASDGKWVSKTTTGLNFTIVWSNTDVYYSEAYEDIGGTLCMAASEPLPVYE